MAKKILYIVIIIALIMAGIFVATKITENDKTKPTVANTLEEENKEANVAEEANNTVELEANEVINNTENNDVENGSTGITPEEQAKQIVKENWGEDNSVYYSYDGKDENGRYVICVREKSTTKALYRYYVDLETGSFDIE